MINKWCLGWEEISRNSSFTIKILSFLGFEFPEFWVSAKPKIIIAHGPLCGFTTLLNNPLLINSTRRNPHETTLHITWILASLPLSHPCAAQWSCPLCLAVPELWPPWQMCAWAQRPRSEFSVPCRYQVCVSGCKEVCTKELSSESDRVFWRWNRHGKKSLFLVYFLPRMSNRVNSGLISGSGGNFKILFGHM